MPDLAILGVFAHPDDEQVMTGVLARYASEGIRTGLICATRGESGQIHESAGHANEQNIGQVREAELRAAAVVVGVKHLWLLDYRDSGWIGTPDNDDPRSLNKCDEDEAVGQIVPIIRGFKPTVIVTFDRTGGYGHLDHIKIHHLTTRAFHDAADPNKYPDAGPPWQASRLYYSAFPSRIGRQLAESMRAQDPDNDFAQLDLSGFGIPDDEITSEIDVSNWSHLKQHSLEQHRTQRADWERWSKLPPEIRSQIQETEYFALGAGVPVPPGPEGREDLFAGLR